MNDIAMFPDQERPRWKVILGDQMYEYAFAPASGLDWAPDSQSLLVCGYEIDIENSPTPSEGGPAAWQVSPEAEKLHGVCPGGGRKIAWSPDGRLYATSRPVQLWEPGPRTRSKVEIATLGPGGVYGLGWSPDGRRIAADIEGGVTVWTVEDGACELELSGQEKRPTSMGWSADGTLIAAGWKNGPLVVWDVPEGSERASIQVERSSGVLAWSPVSNTIALGDGEGGIGLWDAASGAKNGTISGHDKRNVCLCWSPDGRYLATATLDDATRIWEVESGQEVARIDKKRAGWPEHLAWSPDGSRLAAISWESGKYHYTLRIFRMV